MEVDERLRWLEARVTSSLRPKGEDLRRMLVDEDNRTAFLSFCNHSESRCLFVHLVGTERGDGGGIQVSSTPPPHLSDKAMVFLKCSHASKLSRENLAQDVMYTECSTSPLAHLDLVMQEVYLPLMTSSSPDHTPGHAHMGDQLLDLLHRISSSMQITHGYSQGKVVLPLPSVSVLAETALISPDRHSAMVHVLETAVVTWMKQIKMALHCDPSGAIARKCGKLAGPLEEIKFWEVRQLRLEAVREQLSSVPVLSILHNLEMVRSTYAQCFSLAQHDIAQALQEAVHCLAFLRTLQPWLLRLHDAQHPDTMISSFAPITATLLLVWQHSGYYCQPLAFHRLLNLLANEVVAKAKDIIGDNLLTDPLKSLSDLKLALRVCAAFRGCYLDYKEKADVWLKACKAAEARKESVVPTGVGVTDHTPWPLRNSKVFRSLNAVMERCNDLTELVHTMHDFSELEAVGEVSGGVGVTTSEAVIGDIYTQFTTAVDVFSSSGEDLLGLNADGHFESLFFSFRRQVQQLERRLGQELGVWLHRSPSLQAQLRIMETFQCSSCREAVRAILTPNHRAVVTAILCDVEDVAQALTAHISDPPRLPHTPPTASKLVWLHGLGERVGGAMSTLKSTAPELLEGELGWRLRQAYADLVRKLQSYRTEEERGWVEAVPLGLHQKLANMVLAKGPDGQLVVNFDPVLHEVMEEAHHLSRPPLSMRMPPVIRSLMKGMNKEELRDRRAALELVMQTYRDIEAGMREEERVLLHSKLQQVKTLLSTGESHVDWLSAEFPDFLAKCKAAVCMDLHSSMSTLHTFTSTLHHITASWSEVPGLDMFADEGESTLEGLRGRHSAILERLNDILPSCMSRIHSNLASVLSLVHASPESPAWDHYLHSTESRVTGGLIGTVLTAVGSLLHRAHLYEQGVSIPALMAVQLELVGSTVTFSPPLTPHSSLPSIPEIVAAWMNSYVATTRHLPRILPNSKESYQQLLTSDPGVHAALGKISAHLETNSRQAQSLRKRFSQYDFLWEQDVQQTFRAFLQGEAPPHPHRFSQPENVRSRGSARPHSGRPKSSQASLSQLSLQAVVPDTTGLHVVMGVSDWDFLCPSGMEPRPDEDISKRPSLDEFDGELAIFQGINERLCNTEDECNVGWLSVDQKPIKNTLKTLVSKWKAVYAGYLERQMSQVLSSLELFFHEVEPEVERMGGEGDNALSLMALMAIFNKMNTQQVEMDKKFGAVHRAVAMLDKFSHPLPQRLREQFNAAPHRWANLKKRIALGKQRMAPYIQSQSKAITSDLEHFSGRYSTLHRKFSQSECLSHKCGHRQAERLVIGAVRELGGLQEEARNLIELQELLGTSVFNFSKLKEFEEKLSTLSELWTLFESVETKHSEWQGQQWKTVDCHNVEEATGREIEAVEALPSFAHSWDVYQHLLSTLHTTQLTLPLVEGLRSTAIRPRHWKQVLRHAFPSSLSSSNLVSRGGGLDSSALEQLTLRQLMALQLHAHSSEVLQVVERANKEVAIEALLNTFEEVWLSRQLDLTTSERQPLAIKRQETLSELGMESQPSPGTPKPHISSAKITSALRMTQSTAKQSSPSPSSSHHHPSPSNHHSLRLLCNTEGIFETLENHQTSLQSVVGTAASASFTDDLNRWQKQLQTIEAVLGVWLQVQALWVQLEVYLSPEVQQHLPAQSFTFSSVDREWRELLESAASNPSVMTVCLKEGLLAQLEKLQSSLLQCRSTLVGYAEGQRARCHWFHFIPLEDVLQFICCGSQLEKLSSLVHKLLPHASSLVYNHSISPSLVHPPSSSSRHHLPQLSKITSIVSRLGERLDIGQTVLCAGTVESIISSLFSSLSSTLCSQLTTAVSSYVLKTEPTPSSSPHLAPLSSLPSLWASQVSTQVVLLATQLGLDLAVTAALQETERGNKSAFENVCTKIDSLVVAALRMLQGQLVDQENFDSKNDPSSLATAEEVEWSPYPSREADKMGRVPVTPDQASWLRSILLLLTSHRQRALEMAALSEESGRESGLLTSFLWQSRLHWTWSSSERTCHIDTLGARLPYGCHYTGSCTHVVLTPSTERAVVFLLQAAGRGTNTLLTGPEGSGKSSVVHELATMTGQPLFSLHCSSSTSCSTLLSFLQGMALTGCWLLLQSVHCLPPAVLHTASTLLQQTQQARLTRASSLPWLGETLNLNPDILPGVCFAISSFPCGSTPSPDLRRAFVSCSVNPPERRVLLQALLLAHEFKCHHRLAQTLDTVLSAVDELFNSHFSVMAGEAGNRIVTLSELPSSVRPTIPLGLRLLQQIATAGQKYMLEFEKLGVLQGETLEDRSTVLSDISEGARASLKLRATSLEQTQPFSLFRQSLEELSILLSLKDLLLPQLHDTASLSTLILLLTDLFPNSDLEELLAHEEQVREKLMARAAEDHKAGVSARESRAASAMLVAREEPSEVATLLEDHIVQACLLDNLVPSPSFQLAVSQLLSLLQNNQIVGVVGSSCSGKSSVIQVAANAVRGQGAGLTVSWVVPGALEEGELFGKEVDSRWQEGLLPQLLQMAGLNGGSGSGEGGRGGRWAVLDGALSTGQLETLLTLLDPDKLIKLSNGRGIPVDTSYRFILELPSLDCLTPRAAVNLPRLCLSSSTVTWWDAAKSWLLAQSAELASSLEPLLQHLLPPCLEFLAPVLCYECGSDDGAWDGGKGMGAQKSASSIGAVQKLHLHPQDLRLTATHIVKTCCRILEVLLSPFTSSSLAPSPPELKRQLAYSLVWGMGGHLSPQNKSMFNQWWRDTIVEPDLALPTAGLVWDYYPDPEASKFLPCIETAHLLSNVEGGTCSPPFVPTSRAVVVAHLARRLINHGCPVLLVGDPGSGKTALLREVLEKNSNDTSLQHFYASQFTTGQVFWSCLKEHLEWQWGRNYAPLAGKKLVCFIDDLHNSSPSGSLGEVLRGHMTSGGVWEGSKGRWHSVAGTSFVCTAHCGGGYQLDRRLTQHFTVLHWDGYESSDLETIFSTVLSAHLSPCAEGDNDVANRLVQVAVQVHCQLSSLFLPSPDRQHYLFNLRHIAGLFRQLCLQCGGVGVAARDLLLAWQRESWWVYSGVLSSEVDRERYWEVTSHALRKHFSQSNLLPELLQPTSHQLSSSQREALSKQLQQQLVDQPRLHINLYDNLLEELHRLCQLMTSPFDLSHLILVGHTHPDPLVRLAAANCGYTVTQPSLCFSPSLPTTSCSPFGMSPASYSVTRFREDLTSIYTEAGMKDQRLLLLVTSVELLHESYLGLLYEAMCDSHITHLYPREERTGIINAIRSEVTRAGLVFNSTTAWQFFLSRVRQNLRIVLAFPSLSGQPLSTHWRELLSRVNIHCHQPWTQRDLVDVALHHLTASALLPRSLSEGCAHTLAAIHLQLRSRVGLLPTYNCTFQYLVERFVHELRKNQAHLEEHTRQLREGMECVSGAKERAGQVEERLVREERVLEEREEAYGKLLVQLGQDTAISQEHGRLVARQRERVSHLKEVIPEYQLALRAAVEEKLALVLHLKQQVMAVNHASLTELRAQQRPPQELEDLLAAVISVVKSTTADLSWTKGAKRLMANVDRFRELLLGQTQTEDNSETILDSVGPIINQVGLSADKLGTYPGGLAATQLLEWVQGIVKLHSILLSRVRPLEARLENMSGSLHECEEKLRLQEDKMQVLGRRVSGLSEGLENAAVQCSRQRCMVQRMKEELKETREFVEVLSEPYQEWEGQLSTATHALARGLGSLAVSVCVPVYLASSPPHTQLDIVRTVVLPLLRERGVALVWGRDQSAMGSFCQPIIELEDRVGETKAGTSSPSKSVVPKESSIMAKASAPAEKTHHHHHQTLHTQDTSTDVALPLSSYPALCRAVLPQLATAVFSAQWLGQSYSLPAVLAMGLAALHWHRWVLLHDPDGFARQWLRGWKGEELVVVDYRERSFQFYLSIEQALLCGDPLLVEGVASPIDPALQPLLEMGHTWDGKEPCSVRFCGRKIQANTGFTLFLSTSAALSSFPPTLTSIVCVLDFSLSQPWVQEILLKTACNVTAAPQHFNKMLSEVVSNHQKVGDLERKLLALLCSSRQDDYWRLTQKVASTVTARKEAETAQLTLTDQWQKYIAAKAPLYPLVKIGSLIFNLHECSLQYTSVSLTWFLHCFTAALRGDETDGGEAEALVGVATALDAVADVLSASVEERERREREEYMWRRGVLRELATSVMKDAARVMTSDQCQVLACALSLLTISHRHPSSLLTEQLVYLVQGQGYLQEAAPLPSLPSPPSSVSQDMWARLHCIPLSTAYFSRVINSIHTSTDTEFWAGLEQGRGRSIEEFPWKQGREESPSLDDLVLLNLIHESAAMEVISRDTSSLTNSVKPLSMPELLATRDGEKRKPLLLLHDENQLACEVNLSQLQEELQSAIGDKSLKVVEVANSADQGVWSQLTTPTAHCLLVTGLSRCDPKWLPLASARLQQATDSGCSVVAVVSTCCPQLPALSRVCQASLLSHLALRSTTQLPTEARQDGILPTLLYLLSSLPRLTLSQLSSLPTSSQPLLFHLALLHCALYHRSRLAGAPTPSLSLFSSSLSLLLSLPHDHPLPDILIALRTHALTAYSSYCSGLVLEGLVGCCLNTSSVIPGGSFTLPLGSDYGSLEVVTPGLRVPLTNYTDHVMGMMSSETHKRTDILSKHTLSTAVYSLLIPLLMKLPDTQLTPPSASSLSPRRTPSRSIKTATTAAVTNPDQHPTSIPATTTAPSNLPEQPCQHEGPIASLRGADVCTQLPSSQTYLAYLWSKAMEQITTANSATLKPVPEQD